MGTHKITKELELNIIKLYETKSEKEIAKIYNRTQSGIHLILKRNGISKLKNSRLNMSHLSLNVNYFKHINTNDKAYWLGYICADGNIKKTNNKVSLISKDLEVIAGFKKAINAEHTISKIETFDMRTNKIYTGYSIQIGNEIFTQHLINLGVTSNKTDVLEFPNIEEKYYPYFIAGLFDGDGSISFSNKRMRISLISTKEILNFITKILSIKISMCRVSTNKINVWKISVYKDTYKFLSYIYFDDNFEYYLSRKYNKFKYGSNIE